MQEHHFEFHLFFSFFDFFLFQFYQKKSSYFKSLTVGEVMPDGQYGSGEMIKYSTTKIFPFGILGIFFQRTLLSKEANQKS